MDFEIIDFHTHPFVNERNNICSHTAYCNMSMDGTKKIFDNLRVSHICGSVLTPRAYHDAYAGKTGKIYFRAHRHCDMLHVNCIFR